MRISSAAASQLARTLALRRDPSSRAVRRALMVHHHWQQAVPTMLPLLISPRMMLQMTTCLPT
jgi:hypothetical protein